MTLHASAGCLGVHSAPSAGHPPDVQFLLAVSAWSPRVKAYKSQRSSFIGGYLP